MIDSDLNILVETPLSFRQTINQIDKLLALFLIENAQWSVLVMLGLTLLIYGSLASDADH